MPRWSGRLMWRGTANWSKFGGGKHFVVAGANDARLVVYPIAAGETDDTLLTNWVLVHRAAEDGSPLHGREDWQGRADRTSCLKMLDTFVIPDLDIKALASASENIWEYAMCDRNPLPRWSFGRVTLMGDAAYPMYPFGGNGAAQAILDANRLPYSSREPMAISPKHLMLASASGATRFTRSSLAITGEGRTRRS
jgi:2-polyprenyl-6-methoxyphenol hydroxylase-like FAD-dependent oxidoreductase